MSLKLPRILFFIDGVMPTEQDRKDAESLSANVSFRNARAVPDEQHSLEMCDGVSGKVPKLYAERFPIAQVAIAESDAALEKLSKKVGDVKAPTKTQIAAAKKAAEAEEAAKSNEPTDITGWGSGKPS